MDARKRAYAGNPGPKAGSPLSRGRAEGLLEACRPATPCVRLRGRRPWRKAKGRSGARIDPSQESAAAVVRFTALHPRLRHLQPRVSADERGARVYAAAGPAGDRGLYAAGM